MVRVVQIVAVFEVGNDGDSPEYGDGQGHPETCRPFSRYREANRTSLSTSSPATAGRSNDALVARRSPPALL